LRRVSLVEEHGTIKQTDTQCSDACQYSTIPALNTHRIIVHWNALENKGPSRSPTPARKFSNPSPSGDLAAR
jgi:hypothetical protein